MLHSTKCQEILDQILALIDPLRVLAFGSAVNGARRAHDLDFLIVMPEDTDCRRVARDLYRDIRRVGLSIDLIVVTSRDFDELQDAFWSVISQARREGVELYVA